MTRKQATISRHQFLQLPVAAPRAKPTTLAWTGGSFRHGQNPDNFDHVDADFIAWASVTCGGDEVISTIYLKRPGRMMV